MRYIIASDLHGSAYYCKKIKEIFLKEQGDRLILLGDIYYHGPRNPLPYEYKPKEVIKELNEISDKLIVIKGNCDSEVDEMVSKFQFNLEKEIILNDKRFYLTHGHKHNKDNLPENDFDIMCYGHFHTGFIKEIDGKIFVNTGSLSLPKENTENSYILVTEKNITLKNLDGKIIQTINLDKI